VSEATSPQRRRAPAETVAPDPRAAETDAEPAVDEAAEHRLRERTVRLWTEDRARLVFRRPHLATLAVHLELRAVIDERLPTAATNGKMIYVNPYWLDRLPDDERLFVLAHEVWHCALLHFARRGAREPRRWNVAADHEVNALLRRDGFTLPDGAVHIEPWSGLAAEQIYDRLADTSPERSETADVHPGDVGVGGDARASDPKFGPIAGRRDPGWSPSLEPVDASVWADRLLSMEGRLAGLLPGDVAASVAAGRRPSPRWQTALADFVRRTRDEGFSWSPPSRRHAHRGLFLPSRRGASISLALAVDTSGSTVATWPAFVSELHQVVAPYGRYEVRLLQCDRAIQDDATYSDAHPLPRELVLHGGGGTDFRPVFERLATSPPDALVFFTDGFGTVPERSPPYPVLWAICPDGQKPVSWGRTITIL